MIIPWADLWIIGAIDPWTAEYLPARLSPIYMSKSDRNWYLEQGPDTSDPSLILTCARELEESSEPVIRFTGPIQAQPTHRLVRFSMSEEIRYMDLNALEAYRQEIYQNSLKEALAALEQKDWEMFERKLNYALRAKP